MSYPHTSMILVAILVAGTTCPGLVRGQGSPATRVILGDEWPGATDRQRIERLEAELARLRATLESQQMDCGSCYFATCCEDACPRGKCYAGFEFVSVKPRFEDSVELDSSSDAIDWELRLTPRVWFGYAGPAGRGARVRYWQHHRQSNPALDADHFGEPFGRAVFTLEAHVIDLDITEQLQLRGTTLLYGIGFRYVEFDQTVDDTLGPAYKFKHLQGAGPNAMFESYCPTWFSGVSTYGHTRGSILFARSGWGNETGFEDGDDLATVFEAQIGVEYQCDFRWGTRLVTRIGFEGQIWSGVGTTFDDDSTLVDGFFEVDPSDHDIGFLGWVIAVAFTR